MPWDQETFLVIFHIFRYLEAFGSALTVFAILDSIWYRKDKSAKSVKLPSASTTVLVLKQFCKHLDAFECYESLIFLFNVSKRSKIAKTVLWSQSLGRNTSDTTNPTIFGTPLCSAKPWTANLDALPTPLHHLQGLTELFSFVRRLGAFTLRAVGKPCTLNHNPCTLNYEPYTLNYKPFSLTAHTQIPSLNVNHRPYTTKSILNAESFL